MTGFGDLNLKFPLILAILVFLRSFYLRSFITFESDSMWKTNLVLYSFLSVCLKT